MTARGADRGAESETARQMTKQPPPALDNRGIDHVSARDHRKVQVTDLSGNWVRDWKVEARVVYRAHYGMLRRAPREILVEML
mmetsp:Transcript_5559/g.12894  ORF Transcript_5559/g.12894 Transcript_5559/m.12894 type:complete len:83 (-) Transcript_5559:3011-3259(-)